MRQIPAFSSVENGEIQHLTETPTAVPACRSRKSDERVSRDWLQLVDLVLQQIRLSLSACHRPVRMTTNSVIRASPPVEMPECRFSSTVEELRVPHRSVIPGRRVRPSGADVGPAARSGTGTTGKPTPLNPGRYTVLHGKSVIHDSFRIPTYFSHQFSTCIGSSTVPKSPDSMILTNSSAESVHAQAIHGGCDTSITSPSLPSA